MIYGFNIRSEQGRKNFENAVNEHLAQGQKIKIIFCKNGVVVIKVK